MSETLKIVVDDGRIRVPIENLTGEEVGCFYFSPTDLGIIERFNEISKDFEKIAEPLDMVGVNSNGEGVDEESVQAIKEAERRLFKLVDYLFGGNAAEAFFGKINPFSPIGGNFYCVSVMNVVSEFISKQFDSQTKKISRNLAKYTEPYKA